MELYIKAIIHCDGNYAENAKIVKNCRIYTDIKRSDAHDDRVRPIV